MQDAQEFARQKLGECGSGSFRSKERKAHSVVERFKTEWCAEGIPGSSVCLEHKIKEQECRRGYNFRNEVAEGKGTSSWIKLGSTLVLFPKIKRDLQRGP